MTVSTDADVACSAEEKQRVVYRDKVLACLCLAAPATCRADFPSARRLIVRKSLDLLIQQAKLSCLCYRLDPVLHTQFREDTADMAFDRINDNDQFLRNLLVGCTAS